MMDRRRFLKRAVVSSAGFGTLLYFLSKTGNDLPPFADPDQSRRGLIRPPGALPEKDFLAHCIRCQRCVEACPVGAIRLVPAGRGTLSDTPYVLPEVKGCDLCLEIEGPDLLCTLACPTAALEKLSDASLVRMGEAWVDERTCVSHNGTGICGACFTACPRRGKAITQGAHNAPTVHPEECVGCGLCEEACILKGDKAIQVRSERSWA